MARRRSPRRKKLPAPPPARRRLGGAVGLGLVLAASSAFAQDKPADIALPGVDVQAPGRDYRVPALDLFKFPDPLKDTPQSITIVPQQILREQSAYSLREALRNVTGISLAAGEGGVQGDSLTLRGFNARNDIFLDGVRDQGAYSRDTFNLESIEVLKGPSSVMFGRGSTGGVLNLVSKQPQPNAFYSGSATGGSGPFLRGSVDINQPLFPTAALRLNAMIQHAEVVDRDHVEQERWGVAPTFTWGLGTPTRLTVSYVYQHEQNVPDDGLPYLFGEPAPVDRRNFYGLAGRDFEDTDVHIGTVRLEHAFSDDLRLRTTLRYAAYLRDHEITAPRISGTPTPTTPLSAISVSRGRPSRERDDRILTGQTDVIFKFHTWGLEHTLVAGVELAHETADSTTFTLAGIPLANLVRPDAFPALGGISKARNQVAETDAFSVGIFAVGQIAITDQWKLIGGLRWDRFAADFHSRTVATGAVLEVERTDTFVSPRAAVVFQPTAMQTYYFSYGTSSNPSAEALTLAANNVGAAPEKNRTFELGAKWDLLKNMLGLRTALFRIEKTNARTPDPVLGIMTLDGEQRVQGFELEVVGRILPRWNIFAGYTFLDSEVLESKEINNGVPVKGKELANTPTHSASLWTTYDITDKWQVGGGLTFVGSRFGDNGNTNEVPSHVLGDLTVAYKLTRNVELRLNVLNVGDTKYFQQVYQAHVVPGPGRTFLFGANFTY
jgi:catecholate siderophore receptor